MIIDEDDYLAHIGTPRHSGRYPWGSGDPNHTRNRTLLDSVEELRKKGMKDPQIALALGFVNHKGDPSTTKLRAQYAIANNAQKRAKQDFAQKLRDKGMSYKAVADRMGLPGESSVRALLTENAKARADVLTSVSDMLRKEVDSKGITDVGSGSEKLVEKRFEIGEGGVSQRIGVSQTRMKTAVEMLKSEGYVDHNVKVPQIGTGHDTRQKVLCPPGTTWAEAQKAANRGEVNQLYSFSKDGGRTFEAKHPIVAINPKRVHVNFKEDGGDKADGVIYVREGVKDVSLGQNRYAQVRVQVGKDHYLKGMAMYKKDLPEGTDLVFNTNKSRHDPDIKGNQLKAMKEFKKDASGKVDPDHPFGTVTRPIELVGKDGKKHVESSMNIVFEEGQWGTWQKTLSSQFLSKQSPTLAKQQLEKRYAQQKKDLDEIRSLTNPTVKKRQLDDFARSADYSAVHLEAARLHEKQAWHAILPINSMKPTEVYAPNYDHGETVVLVRHPHGGTFEIPQLVVNNHHPEARALLGDAKDAIGISHIVAQHLSGADFDGDTVIVIPNNQRKIKVARPLEHLKDFDPKTSYPKYPGMQPMTKAQKQQQMGNISNLITDMTIKKASNEEIARAVKHSMVVIDAEKHELNWKKSYQDNNIAKLKKDYQGGADRGASTLISRAKAQERVDDRRPAWKSEGGPVNARTGELQFTPTGRMTTNRKGKEIPKQIKSKQLAEKKDAHDLSSGTPMENLYADHSNKLKGLANEARLESLKTPRLTYSDSANRAYPREVSSLNAKLALAQMNRPLERQAQAAAGAIVKLKREANPNLEGDSLRKVKFQALAEARTRLKADQTVIKITPEEWNAIQAGAISDHRLSQILARADKKAVRQLATPRKERLLNDSKTAHAKALLAGGATRAEVAKRLGVSVTTLDASIKGTE